MAERDERAQPRPAPGNRPFVGYLHATDGVPPRVGRSWDIITAGDGIWLAADNPALALRVPVAPCHIRGLAPIGPACALRHGPVPQACWDEAVALCRWHAARGHEFLVLVTLGERGAYRLVAPWQTPTASRVEYALPEGLGLPVIHLHSHHALRAYFSATDDADERGLALYGVVGQLDTPAPEVALRAGAFGHWLALPWSQVFAGDRGPFIDLVADTYDESESRPGGMTSAGQRPRRALWPAWLQRLAVSRDPQRP